MDVSNDFVTLSPRFEKNNIPVVFSTDDSFVPLLDVALVSLATHATEDNNYDINILHKGVSEFHQKRILQLQRSNLSIRFVDISDRMEAFKEHWYIHEWGNAGAWHSDSVYFRFFIPEIFPNYDKVIFMDADAVVCTDIAKLYHVELGEHWLGVVQDYSRQLANEYIARYAEEVLHVPHECYFNAGMMLMNIQQLRKADFLHLCMKTLQELGRPLLQDQDVLNVIGRGKVHYLDPAWNCLFWNINICHPNAKERCEPSLYAAYRKAADEPNIIHFAGRRKPWKEPHREQADVFWRYARKSSFYEEIVYHFLKQDTKCQLKDVRARDAVLRDAIVYSSLRRSYYRCKMLRFLTFGKRKAHYKTKCDQLKARIRRVRRFIATGL